MKNQLRALFVFALAFAVHAVGHAEDLQYQYVVQGIPVSIDSQELKVGDYQTDLQQEPDWMPSCFSTSHVKRYAQFINDAEGETCLALTENTFTVAITIRGTGWDVKKTIFCSNYIIMKDSEGETVRAVKPGTRELEDTSMKQFSELLGSAWIDLSVDPNTGALASFNDQMNKHRDRMHPND